MNDKDFDKIFGDKLREERSFSSQDSDWEQLSSRLDTAKLTKENDKRRRGLAWLWLLMIPILSLLLWQMNDIKHQNQQLATQLAAMQSQLVAHALVRDTVVQIVRTTDTVVVYKDKSVIKLNKITNAATDFSNTLPLKPNDIPLKKGAVSSDAKILATQKSIVKQDTLSPKQINNEHKIAELQEKLNALDKQITDLIRVLSEEKANSARLIDCGTKQDSLKKQLVEASTLIESLKTPPLSTETKKTDKLLKNNRLFIGIQGGQISYRTTWINTVGVSIYKDIKSYQAGLKLEYALTDKLRLIAEGDFCPFSFTNYWQDPRYNLPALQFDPQKEKFLKSEAKQNLLQSNLGVKYLFTEGASKWRPSVSVAYTIMRINPFETKFTYQPAWGTTNREQTVQSAAIKVPNLLMLSGGLEYRFSKYGVAQAEAFYYKDVNKTHKTFDLFGLRAAILLNLK